MRDGAQESPKRSTDQLGAATRARTPQSDDRSELPPVAVSFWRTAGSPGANLLDKGGELVSGHSRLHSRPSHGLEGDVHRASTSIRDLKPAISTSRRPAELAKNGLFNSVEGHGRCALRERIRLPSRPSRGLEGDVHRASTSIRDVRAVISTSCGHAECAKNGQSKSVEGHPLLGFPGPTSSSRSSLSRDSIPLLTPAVQLLRQPLETPRGYQSLSSPRRESSLLHVPSPRSFRSGRHQEPHLSGVWKRPAPIAT